MNKAISLMHHAETKFNIIGNENLVRKNSYQSIDPCAMMCVYVSVQFALVSPIFVSVQFALVGLNLKQLNISSYAANASLGFGLICSTMHAN